MSSTIKYFFKDIPEKLEKDPKPIISVEFESCLNLEKKYPNSVIHNFANNERPGGPTSTFSQEGILLQQKLGSNTQEDVIIRKYGQKLVLPKYYYPIIDNSVVGSEALLYSTCEKLQPVITLPAINCPNFKNKKTRQSLINRLLLLLWVCSLKEKTLITGLWGCGAFGMSPEDLVDCWKEALKLSKYQPKQIVFTILLDNYTKHYKKDTLVTLFSL